MKYTLCVTQRCSLRCRYCYIAKHDRAMPLDVAARIVDFAFGNTPQGRSEGAGRAIVPANRPGGRRTNSWATERSAPALRRLDIRGGIRMPHLHFKGEIHLLNEEQWKAFAGQALKSFHERLASEDVMCKRGAMNDVTMTAVTGTYTALPGRNMSRRDRPRTKRKR